jgi:hypothetical protein
MLKVCTLEHLRSVPVDKLSPSDKFFEKWRQHPTMREEELVALMPSAMKFFASMFHLEMEVANGGFCQYFWNSWVVEKDRTREAIEGYFLIGVPEAAVVVNEASGVANRPLNEISGEKDSAKAFLDLRFDPNHTDWNALDHRMYELEKQITLRRGIFISEHPDQFVF